MNTDDQPTMVRWHRNQAEMYLRLARFCRRHYGDLSLILPGQITGRIRDYYRSAIVHARHAREFARSGRPHRAGRSL